VIVHVSVYVYVVPVCPLGVPVARRLHGDVSGVVVVTSVGT